MKLIKGAAILDYVRMIRANPDKDWNRWLTPKDWEVVHSQILPSQRYSYQTFRHIAFAVFKEIGGGSLEVARQFGRFTMKNWIEIYKTSILEPGDPVRSIEKMVLIRRKFMDIEDETKVAERGPDWVRYQIIHYADEADEERKLAYAYQVAGQLEEIALQAGAQNPSTTVSSIPGGNEILMKWTAAPNR
jgi:hypothetical protein